MLNTSIGKDYNYAHIISGEDYPTKPAEEIIAAFNGDDKIYCDYDLISGKKHHAYRRYCFYWPYTRFSLNYKKPLVRYFNLLCVGIQACFPFLKRNHFGELKKYTGDLFGEHILNMRLDMF